MTGAVGDKAEMARTGASWVHRTVKYGLYAVVLAGVEAQLSPGPISTRPST